MRRLTPFVTRLVALLAAPLVALVVLAGCGASDTFADPADPGDDGPVGAKVLVGRALAGGRVPLLDLGGDGDHPGRAWVVDAATGELEGLPPFPEQVWWAEGTVVATDRWTVLSGWACAAPTVDDDTGDACTDAGRDVVMALGAGEAEWREVETDIEWTTPWPVAVTDDVVTFSVATPPEYAGSQEVTVDLSVTPLALGPLGAVGPDRHDRTCSFGQAPQLTFATDDGPTTAVLPAPGGGPGEEVDLPADLGLTGPDWGGVICWSSGRVLMVRVPDEVADETWAYRLHDLATGGLVAEVDLGDAPDLAAAGDRVVLIDDRQVTVLALDGEELARADIAANAEVRATEVGTVVVEREAGDDGWLRFAGVEVLDA